MRLYQHLNEIYSCLQDEVSKDIFRNRALFSLTNEKKYMYDIVKNIPEKKFLENDKEEAYIFGCGFYGKLVHEHIKKSWLGFVDNNPQKERINGLDVISPDELPKDACVYVAVKYYANEIEEQLLNLGINKINIVNVGKILMNLGDRQYFDLLELPHVLNEVFVDAGCLNGISSKNFVNWAWNKYSHIYCFEADYKNADVCKMKMQNLVATGKVTIINKALSSKNGKASFVSKANGTSSIGVGRETVETVSMDSILGDKRITFIKMDIEGAEYNALLGAKKIICEQRPKLAISIYHHPEDIFDIPNLILSYCPDYKLYLRHYSLFDEETVLYAI